jgi:tetratricopeptide (TPR) repeat protein
MIIMDNIFSYYTAHFYLLFSIHIFIILLLAFFFSRYATKRFTTVCDADAYRLQGIQERSLFFKFLFSASLHKNNPRAIFLFVIAFNLAIPYIGYFFTLWLFWYMTHIKYQPKAVNTNMLNLDEFETSFLKIERTFGEGSMINLINNIYVPKSKKIKALSILAENPSPISLSIIKQTLTSEDDEIRLFGYAILNKTEKTLNYRINKYLEIIRNESTKADKKDEQKVAFASKELAFLYWEMVYTELSHESLKQNFLNSALLYLELAQEFYMEKLNQLLKQFNTAIETTQKSKTLNKLLEESYLTCSTIFTLKGRIFTVKQKYEKAQEYFTLAQQMLSENSTTILPYLAEVYFITHRYSIVKSILNHSADLAFNPKLYPVIKQWEVSHA